MPATTRSAPWWKWSLAALAGVGLGAAGWALRPDRRRPVAVEAGAKPAPPRPADVPARVGPAPAVWAVVVGVDQYDDPAVPACHGAAADAREVARWFRQAAGWGDRNVLLLDDREGRAPGPPPTGASVLAATRANLQWAARDWLKARVKPGDTVALYFAGQAVGLPPRDPAEPGAPGRDYLLPVDARAADPDATGWSAEDAVDALAADGTVRVVCWLDTSPAGRGRGAPGKAKADAGAGDRWLRRLARWPGTTAWLAASDRPAAEAEAVGRRSPFTAALLRGLGTAERPHNLLACLAELNRDPALAGRGFRAAGGVAPDLDLWSGRARRRADAGRQLLLQRAHADHVSAVAFTADGGRLVTASRDSTVRVWRAEDRALLRALSQHAVGVTALALGPDGRLIASGDGLGSVRLWDAVNHRERPAGPPHERGVDFLDILPGGDRLVSLDLGGRAWLREVDAPDGALVRLSDACTGAACARPRGPLPLALARDDGTVLRLDPAGKAVETLAGPGGTVTSPRLATNGRFLAAGDDRGRVRVWDAGAPSPVFEETYGGPVDLVHLTPAGLLAVASGPALHLTPLGSGKPGGTSAVTTQGPVSRLAASDDGRTLAACTTAGALHLWRIDDAGKARSVVPDGAGETGFATAVALSPDGRTVVTGDQDGGLRFWSAGDGAAGPRVPRHRGQVVALGVSDDGRYMLQVTRDGAAQVWDFAEGRGPTTVAGRWSTGALAPAGDRLALIDQETGDVVAADRDGGRRRAVSFPRPKTGGEPCRFGTVAFSRDPGGTLLAAGSVDGPAEGPTVCVWESRTGKPLHALRGHDDPHPVTALDFSADSRRLLSASEDGTARVWDLAAGGAPPARVYHARDPATGEDTGIRAARFGAADGRTVLAGCVDGRVLFWGPGADAPPAALATLTGPVRAVAATPDGRWLAAAGGADRAVRLWSNGPTPRAVRLDPAPNHTEGVNALTPWPDGRLLASGSDDTSVRLWSLEDRGLLGTLTAEQGTEDWVIYTPDGLFDSSAGGERRVTWLVGNDVLPLDQFYDRARVFQLGDRLRRGERPEAPAPAAAPPPRLSLDAPGPRRSPGPEAVLTLLAGEPGLTDVRLYQNGAPILDGPGAGLAPGGRRAAVRVRLRRGVNTFYAMASRPGSIDGRSNVVEVEHAGDEEAGRLHTLALGVSRYRDGARSLQFADADAEQIAAYLHEHGVGASGRGLRLVLTNDEVTEANVEARFRALRDGVAGRPQDTVVVFIAGHTDVLAGRFHLLLPGFPFPPAGKGLARAPVADPSASLPYATVYRNLARLNALQRLVIIDACQAEAIDDDPGVRLIRRMVDDGAHRARTAYLLAARRGEPANEVPALGHGLMSYVLLQGMGDRKLKPLPDDSVFREVPSADRNGDGRVATDELRWFADLTLPRLASQFPLLVQRAGGARGAAPPPQGVRVQSSVDSFQVVALPADAPEAGPGAPAAP